MPGPGVSPAYDGPSKLVAQERNNGVGLMQGIETLNKLLGEQQQLLVAITDRLNPVLLPDSECATRTAEGAGLQLRMSVACEHLDSLLGTLFLHNQQIASLTQRLGL